MMKTFLQQPSITVIALVVLLSGCRPGGDTPAPGRGVPVTVQTPAFKKYWYDGEAELSRYKLQQIRYGQVREGEAVLVFVTEDFLTGPQVKLESERNGREAETVLKLNFMRDFVTGIYDYHVMTSTFSPVETGRYPHALKVASSTQEWCGTTYAQLNLRGGTYRVTGHSYFEGEADYERTLDETWLEDELWTQLRLSPELLPEGTIDIIPAAFSVRTSHSGWSVQRAEASRAPWTGEDMPGDSLMQYRLRYPDAGRSLTIVYEPAPPYRIAGWVERQRTRGGDTLRATSVRTHLVKTAYWKQNASSDEMLRTQLGLDR